MIYAILTIIFIAGLRVSLHDWKQTVRLFSEYRQAYKRGIHPSDFFIECTCGNCTAEELEEKKTDAYQDYINNLANNVSIQLHQSIFHSGITLIAIYIFIQLTLNP